MQLAPDLKPATFRARINRFAATAVCDGREVVAHVANSGRLHELFEPGRRVYLDPVTGNSDRKTAYDLLLVDLRHTLVSVDARLPNKLLREAIEAGRLAELGGFDHVSSEVTFHKSRLDLVLSNDRGLCYVEAKSITLVEDGTGLFPDSPTARGRKHLYSLIEAAALGHRAAIAFVIQRPDVVAFAPNEDADPEFCETLREAVDRGVEAYAYRCNVSTRSVEIVESVPVRI